VSSARFDGIGARSGRHLFTSPRIALVALVFAIVTGVPAQAAVAQADGSSRETPVALGEPGTVGDYEVTVTDVTPNADDLIVAENLNNVPPGRGRQYFMAAIAVTYLGTEIGDLEMDLWFNSVGQSNIGLTTDYADSSCGVVPDRAYDVPDLQEGDTAEFNICWKIYADDADSLVMYASLLYDFEDEPVWFSLGNDAAASAVATPAPDVEIITESSIEEPIAVGEAGQVGDFLVEVLDAQPDATDLVVASDFFNEPPEAGNQYYLARVRVTYTGETRDTPGFDLYFRATGESEVEYNTADNSCGWVPDNQASASELFPGGTVDYNVCWQVASADAESLVMVVESFSAPDPEPAWFSLGTPVTAADSDSASTEDSVDEATPATSSSESEADDPEVVTDSTQTSPIPLGEVGQVGDFQISVLEVTPNATDVVLEENQFNDPPAVGHQFYIARVKVTLVGDESAYPPFDLNFQSVGDSAVSYTTFDPGCGVYPDDYYFAGELFPGRTIEVNVCWQIDSTDEDSLVMYVEPLLSTDSDPVWFALTEE
jgi:hypothetical protein